MRIIITAIAVITLLMPAHANEFHLTDAAGKMHGPFTFKEGETLFIAGQEYTISKVLTKEQKIVEKMKSIIIPEIDIRQANVLDVIAFLKHQSMELDTKSELGHRGVSIVLNHALPATQPLPSRFADSFFASEPQAQSGTQEIPLITFTASQLSLHDTINIICKICDLRWSIQDSVIMFEQNKKEQVQQPPAP